MSQKQEKLEKIINEHTALIKELVQNYDKMAATQDKINANFKEKMEVYRKWVDLLACEVFECDDNDEPIYINADESELGDSRIEKLEERLDDLGNLEVRPGESISMRLDGAPRGGKRRLKRKTRKKRRKKKTKKRSKKNRKRRTKRRK